MARQAFTPPDDTDDEVLDFLATGRPPAAPRPAPAVDAPTVPGTQPVVAPRAMRPATAPPARASRPAPARRVVAPAPQPASVRLKRIGLYVDVPTWAQLKQISLQRAERGLDADFTTIVLEALRAQYPEGRWAKR